MGIIGEWEYKFVMLDSDQLDYARKMVERGEGIFRSKETPLPVLASWVSELKILVRSIDALGEDYSGSIASDLVSASWFGGNYPGDEEQFRLVYAQYLGIARSLLSGPIKIVASKR